MALLLRDSKILSLV